MNKKEIGKRVWELFTEGYSYNKIAKKLKISKSVVSNVINYCSPCSYSLSKKITQKLKELEEENKKLKELEQENEKLKNNLQELQELQNLQETKHIILGLIIFVLSILIIGYDYFIAFSVIGKILLIIFLIFVYSTLVYIYYYYKE